MWTTPIGSALKKFIPPLVSSSPVSTTLENLSSPHLQLVPQQKSENHEKTGERNRKERQPTPEPQRNEESEETLEEALEKKLQAQRQNTPSFPAPSPPSSSAGLLLTLPPQGRWLQSTKIQPEKKSLSLQNLRGSMAYEEQRQVKRRKRCFKKGTLMDERVT